MRSSYFFPQTPPQSKMGQKLGIFQRNSRPMALTADDDDLVCIYRLEMDAIRDDHVRCWLSFLRPLTIMPCIPRHRHWAQWPVAVCNQCQRPSAPPAHLFRSSSTWFISGWLACHQAPGQICRGRNRCLTIDPQGMGLRGHLAHLWPRFWSANVAVHRRRCQWVTVLKSDNFQQLRTFRQNTSWH